MADNGGATSTTSQSVTVSSSSTTGISLTATGYEVEGVQHADLTWHGSTSVDVYRNGAPIGQVSGTSYTDDIGTKGGGSYTYEVCDTGTGACSNEVTITFA